MRLRSKKNPPLAFFPEPVGGFLFSQGDPLPPTKRLREAAIIDAVSTSKIARSIRDLIVEPDL